MIEKQIRKDRFMTSRKIIGLVSVVALVGVSGIVWRFSKANANNKETVADAAKTTEKPSEPAAKTIDLTPSETNTLFSMQKESEKLGQAAQKKFDAWKSKDPDFKAF